MKKLMDMTGLVRVVSQCGQVWWVRPASADYYRGLTNGGRVPFNPQARTLVRPVGSGTCPCVDCHGRAVAYTGDRDASQTA